MDANAEIAKTLIQAFFTSAVGVGVVGWFALRTKRVETDAATQNKRAELAAAATTADRAEDRELRGELRELYNTACGERDKARTRIGELETILQNERDLRFAERGRCAGVGSPCRALMTVDTTNGEKKP